MTFREALDRWGFRAAYVAGAGFLVALAALLVLAGAAWSPLVVSVAVIYLGPLGLALLLIVLLFPSLPAPIAVLAAVSVAVAVAIANVAIVRRWSALADQRGAAPDGGERFWRYDRLLGGTSFVASGCVFLLLTVVAGFAALTAHGIDVRAADALANRVILVAAITWCLGFVLAIAGLILWIMRATRRRVLVPWAASEFAVMVGLIAAFIVGVAV
ncbi:hypothetical protein [Leifsonia sp. 2MCAF36]|uniref:hypothetical protein n=1 Tax=Leifsonia sp. 2MCAF36 TaxID=3232988 RepID=UPI003F9DEF94